MNRWTDADRRTLEARMSAHIDGGELPGLVALVARDGRPDVVALGTLAFGSDVQMARDSVFRIASISKPITAAAAMVLVDDRIIRPEDPVANLLPELASPSVLRDLTSELDDTVPAHRAITVEDVLTFRLGFGSVMAMPGTYPIQRAEAELQLMTLGPPWPPADIDANEWIRRFASLPLLAQPGEAWMYNTGAQVLGVLIERAAGMPLEEFMRERLFNPLGMVDTGFSMRPDQAGRFTTAYAPDPTTGAPVLLDPADGGWWSRPPAMPNCAGGLLSTVDDLWRFAEMLLQGGSYDGRRVLSPESVAAMTQDHLTPAQRADNPLFLGAISGWGYAMAVPAADLDPSAPRPADELPGGYGWDGGTGTTWRSDVARGVTGILLTQRAMTSPQPPAIFRDFWACAYGLAG